MSFHCCSFWPRCSRRSLAADLFFENFHTPQVNGRDPGHRPLGPRGTSWCQTWAATAGWSRLATVQALGGLMMADPLPEISQRLLEPSSQGSMSGGRYFVSSL